MIERMVIVMLIVIERDWLDYSRLKAVKIGPVSLQQIPAYATPPG